MSKRITIRVDDETHEKFMAMAKTEKRTESQMGSVLVGEALKAREAAQVKA